MTQYLFSFMLLTMYIEHSCLLSITPCISCLSYAREPEARPLGWLALKICTYIQLYTTTLFKKYMHRPRPQIIAQG